MIQDNDLSKWGGTYAKHPYEWYEIYGTDFDTPTRIQVITLNSPPLFPPESFSPGEEPLRVESPDPSRTDSPRLFKEYDLGRHNFPGDPNWTFNDSEPITATHHVRRFKKYRKSKSLWEVESITQKVNPSGAVYDHQNLGRLSCKKVKLPQE
jgi:hypothetical protein